MTPSPTSWTWKSTSVGWLLLFRLKTTRYFGRIWQWIRYLSKADRDVCDDDFGSRSRKRSCNKSWVYSHQRWIRSLQKQWHLSELKQTERDPHRRTSSSHAPGLRWVKSRSSSTALSLSNSGCGCTWVTVIHTHTLSTRRFQKRSVWNNSGCAPRAKRARIIERVCRFAEKIYVFSFTITIMINNVDLFTLEMFWEKK